MDHKKALEDKLNRYANFHMSQIRKEESEYNDSDDDLDPKVEAGLKDDSPVIERTLSNSSRFSKEQLIHDANKILKTESFDRSTGNSTPTSKKKSVVIIAPRTSSFSVSSRTSSQHQMSSASASPTTVPEVKGVALLPPADSPISFKTEGYADTAWQNLNEKLDLLLKTDSYRTLSSSDLHSHLSSTSDIPRSPKRTPEESTLQKHGSNNSLVNGERLSSAEVKIESRSPVPGVTSSRSVLGNASANGTHSSNDLTRVMEQEAMNSNGSPNMGTKDMMKKKSSRSLMKRLSSHNVMVDNTLYIDDDSADEEEEVYGVAMNSSKQQQDVELDRMLQVKEKRHEIMQRSMSGCSSDEDDIKPVKVRDLRRAASYVYDQREQCANTTSSNNLTGQQQQQQQPSTSGPLSVIVEITPPPSTEVSPRDDSKEQQRLLHERELQQLIYQQQLQIQQLQLQQQKILEQQQLQFLMSQQSPVEPKTLKQAPSIEKMALAYIKEAQSLANSHVLSPAVSAVVNVTESWKAQSTASPITPQLLPPPLYPSTFPSVYPPQHPHSNSNGVSPQKLPREQKSLASASLDELLAMGLKPAEAHAIYAEHVQVRSAGHSQGHSRSSSPALNKNSNVDGFMENPLNSSQSSLSSLNRADFIERTISAEVDLTNIYDDARRAPSHVPQLKYVPSRQGMPPSGQMDSPQLSQRSGSNSNVRHNEEYPPTGKLKRSNSSSRHVSISDDVSVSSHVSKSSNGSAERIAVGPSWGIRDRSPAQAMPPPLYMSSPPNPHYRSHHQHKLDQQSLSMTHMPPVDSDQKVYNRSYSDPVSLNNSAGSRNGSLSRSNIEQQSQTARLRPARMELMASTDRYSTVSSLSDGDRQDSFVSGQYMSPPGGYPQHYQHPPLSRSNSNASAYNNAAHSSFPYPREVLSHPFHPYHIQRQSRSPIPFSNYISIMEDTRQPDDVALDLGLTLSKQESMYGCNMFDWYDPQQDENEVQYLMELGYARNTAIEMIFDRSRRGA